MKIFRIAMMIALATVMSLSAAGLSAAAKAQEESFDTILVAFNPGTPGHEIAALHQQNGAKVEKTIPSLGVQVLSVGKGQVADKVKEYKANKNVVYAEPDFIAQTADTPDDAYFGQQWGLSRIDAADAWSVTIGSPSVVIAILDTGIDAGHPDLAGKVLDSVNFSSSATEADVKGHGTHVAGIAAAVTNNGLGVAGIGYNSSLLNVKVLGDDGSGSYSAISQGIVWATENDARVINMSLSGSSSSLTLENAINYAWSRGVVVVAAAGNNGNSTPVYPAYYSNVIAVGATDSSDNLSSFSNRGDWVDVGAPGSSIYSTLIGNGYGYKSGTSMAAPFVAGLAGLIAASEIDRDGNGLLNDEIRQDIETNCDSIGVAGIGSGRINAARSAAALAPGVPPTDPGPPPPPPPAPEPGPEIVDIWVEGIDFTVNGKNLMIKARVNGETGAVGGVQVTLVVVSGGKTWNLSAVTDSYGIATVSISKAPVGQYQVTVSALTATGCQWDETKGVVSADYTMSAVGKGRSK